MAVLILLAAGGLAGWRFWVVSSDVGFADVGHDPAPVCALDDETRSALHVQARTGGSEYEYGSPTSFECFYGTGKGNSGTRFSLTVKVTTFTEVRDGKSSEVEQARSLFQQSLYGRPTDPGGSDFGDESCTYVSAGRVDSIVRKGASIIDIDYFGVENQFFGEAMAPDSAVRDAVKRIAPILVDRVGKG